MCRSLKIDFVSPPYAGHLFPLLDLASNLAGRGFTDLRILSTAQATRAIQLCGLTGRTLLAEHDHIIHAISDTSAPVGFNPFRLYRQFQMTMSMMDELHSQLLREWTVRRPDLVIADFTVPIAGLVAEQLGIRWWTTTPSPCAMESLSGTPSYLGGWTPAKGKLGGLRDAVGRRAIRLFKRTVAMLFTRQLRRFGFKRVYRADGYESIYSPERILGLGMREFEFERDWPAGFEFIGPLTGCPTYPHVSPDFSAGKPTILITLGTHLPWARQPAEKLIAHVAQAMPEFNFHFASGKPDVTVATQHANLHHFSFIPYHKYLPHYVAAIIHGGTGIIYECIRAGVPMLVWPLDFDHHDHAARIVNRGIGRQLRPNIMAVCNDLRELASPVGHRLRVREFQQLLAKYNPYERVMSALGSLAE